MIQSKIQDLLLKHYRVHGALPSYVQISFEDMIRLLTEMMVPINKASDGANVTMITGYGKVRVHPSYDVREHMVRIVEYHDFRDALKEATDD